jgi:hypothetical protein
VRFPARFFCQGSSLRSDERKTRGLDSACGKALGTATKGICFFFSSGNHARKKKERGKQNDRKATCHLRRTTAGGGRKAGANARSLHRLPQLQLRKRITCAGTVHPPQSATRTTQYLSRMARTETAGPQRGKRNHPLHAHALQKSKKATQTDSLQGETAEPQTCYAFRFRPYCKR